MRRLILPLLALSMVVNASVQGGKQPKPGPDGKSIGKKASTLWRQPYDIKTRDLFYGPGGQAGQPRPPFRFIEEDRDGSNPKFAVIDSRGVRWKVKLGEEGRPETTATRLLWAVGYHSDINYYLPRVRVAGLPKLSRGQKYVSPDGTIHGARFERAFKKLDDWSWFNNPFVGTREFDGLRVMMALMNNWDLKQQNNGIYEAGPREQRYVVSDLGGTFGRTGGDWTRSKGEVDDFVQSKFIDKASNREVDFVLNSRPPILYALAVPYYRNRVRMEKVSEDIPRSHARWIGQWLSQLSHNQIRDAFRAAGYPLTEVNAYTHKVRERISQLNRL